MLWKTDRNLKQILFLLLLVFVVVTGDGNSVKKELKDTVTAMSDSPKTAGLPVSNSSAETQEVITIKSHIDHANNYIGVDEPIPRNRYRDEIEIPDSYKIGFYLFIGISTAAIIMIIARIYGLRLSRAERRYGVQGDRSTQELTPLPVSIEDDESDNEDHTLFEVNRQIRIV